MKDLNKILNEIQAELTELRKMVEPNQPYIPKPGEDFDVGCNGLNHTVDAIHYLLKTYFSKELGVEPAQPKQPDEIEDALKYKHLLPEGYCFCEEADAEEMLKVEIIPNISNQREIGYITGYKGFNHSNRKFYRPICRIKPSKTIEPPSRVLNSHIDSPQITPDYTHLLPEGYEFCKDEQADKWIKVERPDSNEPQSPIGSFVDIEDMLLFREQAKSMYRPIRKIKQASFEVDWSNAPEWADVHCYDENGYGYWYGAKFYSNTVGSDWVNSNFTLPSGLDWKQSKTRRPV